MDDKQLYDWSYMAKLTANELNPTEEEHFLQRLEYDEDLRIEYKVFNKSWQQLEEFTIKSGADANSAWERQQKMIMDHENKTNDWSIVLRLAAVFLLIFGLIFIFYNGTTDYTIIETLAYEEQEVTLPDGTIVFLNQNSSIKYPNDFITNRNVQLQGEAFFDVIRNEKSPFTVSIEKSLVQVLGTSFYIKSSKDQMTVFVKTGKVSYQLLDSEEEYLLTPGVIVYTYKGSTSVMHNQNHNILSWKDKHMYFDEMALTDALEVISNTFNTTIIYQEKQLANCRLSAEYNNLPLHDVLDVLATIFSLEINYVGNTITISGGNCELN